MDCASSGGFHSSVPQAQIAFREEDVLLAPFLPSAWSGMSRGPHTFSLLGALKFPRMAAGHPPEPPSVRATPRVAVWSPRVPVSRTRRPWTFFKT